MATTETIIGSSAIHEMTSLVMHFPVLNLDAALAIHSRLDECNYGYRQAMQALSFLSAVLASRFGPQEVLQRRDNPNSCGHLLVTTLSDHCNRVCSSAPAREDQCTIVMRMIIGASSSVPAMVLYAETMPELYSQAQGIFDDNQDESTTACSLLFSRIMTAMTRISGPDESTQTPSAVELLSDPIPYIADEDAHETETVPVCEMTEAMRLTFQAIVTAVNERPSDSPSSLDMVMLSQATWGFIEDIERVLQPRGRVAPPVELTQSLGRVIYDLVIGRRSKFSSLERSATTNAAQYPSDTSRKLINGYYKAYCARLGLQASPTTLHVLIRTFGRPAIDSFPVSILIALGQSFTERELLSFFSIFQRCRGSVFLWPSLGSEGTEDSSTSTLLRLADAVEMILYLEYSQLFALLSQCNCTVSALIARWVSQCFWNYLNWEQILLVVYLTVLYGSDFEVYIIVAILKHLEPAMRRIVVSNGSDAMSAYVDLLQHPIAGFRFAEWKGLFLRLRSDYHEQVDKILMK
ncbi:hypothetical protein PINS_up006260 [Pythium insidiosum]|nr:hypothetical protein PINS_up006260 [Pythium insidiosum]